MTAPAAPPAPAAARIQSIQRPHRNLIYADMARSLAGVFLAPIVFIPFFFKYVTLRYRIDDEGISASWGILFRREIHLTYKRIQDIHVKRGIVERWLGIATVDVQTASGSSSAELSLEGMDDYEAVRDYLYGRRRGHVDAPTGGGAAKGAPGDAPGDAVRGAELIGLLNEIRDELTATREALERRG
jgi:putative membrane protein